MSYRTGILPSDWKSANVIPIHKKGPTKCASNYRPISLTSEVVKVMEIVIRRKIVSFLVSNSLIDNMQHGFLKKRSTVTQLLSCLNNWTKEVDRKKHLDVVYLDIAKAFDSVSHPKLIEKLKSLNFSDTLVNWLENYLTNRVQMVKIENSISRKKYVTSGVPQGSILGPILFLIYINDLSKVVKNSKIALYADDSKIYFSFNSNMNNNLLIEDMKLVFDWASKNQLKIAFQKSAILHFGRGNNTGDLILGDISIPNEEVMKDLGVWISNDLKFSNHINKMAKSCFQMTNLMFLSFETQIRPFLVNLFKTFVRSKLEYASEVWSPSIYKDIDLIESVQRRFTKRIPGCRNLSYPERLKLCNLESLELRRLKSDLVFVYKLIHNLVDIPFEDFLKYSNSSSIRGNETRLLVQGSRLKIREDFFSNRVVKVWNSLDQNVVSSKTLYSFRSKLDKYNLSAFLRYTVIHVV